MAESARRASTFLYQTYCKIYEKNTVQDLSLDTVPYCKTVSFSMCTSKIVDLGCTSQALKHIFLAVLQADDGLGSVKWRPGGDGKTTWEMRSKLLSEHRSILTYRVPVLEQNQKRRNTNTVLIWSVELFSAKFRNQCFGSWSPESGSIHFFESGSEDDVAGSDVIWLLIQTKAFFCQ